MKDFIDYNILAEQIYFCSAFYFIIPFVLRIEELLFKNLLLKSK